MMKPCLTFLLLILIAVTPLHAELGVERLAKLRKSNRSKVLLTHGINVTTDELLFFLENGFSERMLRLGLPDEPTVKSEVYNYSIQELGFQQSQKAVPQLIAIMEGEISSGLSSVLARDTETYPIETGDQIKLRHHNHIRFNSMVALGFIGNEDAIVPIRHFIRTQQSPSYSVEGAIALALLNDDKGIEIVLEKITDPSHELADEMFKAIYIITGRNYDITNASSYAKKEDALSKLKTWASTQTDVQFVRTDILRRRLQNSVVEDLPVSTVRGALRATKDFQDYDRRYAGRNFLRSNGAAIVDELRLISNDMMEDLDIRTSAMEWYAASNPKQAKKDFKNLRDKDQDEIIRQKAEILIQDIDDMKDS